MNTKPYIIALSTLAATSTAFAQDLKIQNFLAQPEHFGVTSTLIEGDKEVLLVQAQQGMLSQNDQAAASACSRSAIKSSICSMPIDKRTVSSVTPAFANSSGFN